MGVRFSPRARQDLRDIILYIVDDNPSRAVSFAEEIEQACLQLAEYPLRFALIPRYERFGYRRRPHGRYSIFYTLIAKDIFIVRIVPSAMDLVTVLGED